MGHSQVWARLLLQFDSCVKCTNRLISPATFAKGTAPGLGERRTQALERYLARATQFFILASAVLMGRAYGQRVPPANDNFANRLALIGANITTNANNLYATSEPDEPRPSNLAGDRSVWWTWTASRDGVLTVSTAGSDFDTVLGVFTGNSLSNLSLAAFNDNDPVERIPTSRVILNASARAKASPLSAGKLAWAKRPGDSISGVLEGRT